MKATTTGRDGKRWARDTGGGEQSQRTLRRALNLLKNTRQRGNHPALRISLAPYTEHARAKDGAHDRNRTDDLILTKNVLYRLSYMGKEQLLYSGPLYTIFRPFRKAYEAP